MQNEDKIIELLTESLKGQDRIVTELKGTNQRLDQTVERLDRTVERLDGLETRVDKIDRQLVKLNLQTAENTRAILRLGDKVGEIADLHNRVTKLERTVYK